LNPCAYRCIFPVGEATMHASVSGLLAALAAASSAPSVDRVLGGQVGRLAARFLA